MSRSIAKILAVVCMSAFIAACAEGGYTRGMFSGYVMGKTEMEVMDKVGKPSRVDRISADQYKLIYERKTFNPDDSNKVDSQAVLSLRKDEQGKITVYDVDFL